MKLRIIAFVCALLIAAGFTGCAAPADNFTEGDIPAAEAPSPLPELPVQPRPAEPEPPVATVTYIEVTEDNVNIRGGAGVQYSKLGTAEKSTLYTVTGKSGDWYVTKYRNKTAYVNAKYCREKQFLQSENERVEAVIAEGCALLGTPYVYGAVRYHDGKGNKLRGFTVNAFDCSSLMQYVFYKGADKLLQVNTRTQIYQGTTVKKSQLKRGDLIFFTNASRANNSGIERVGHVALYLGDDWILHTASDYAKIERMNATRWGYYIQTQRMI